jgi:hypothetical protein
VLRKLLLLALALVLLVPACGGDDDDNDTASDTTVEKKTTTTEDDAGDDEDDDAGEHEGDDTGTLSDDEYEAAFAESLINDDSGFGLSESEAQCATDEILDEIGAERLQEAGMTELYLNTQSGDPTDLTDEEARTIVDALFDCADMGEAFASQVAGDLEDEENITPEQAQCFGDAVGEDDAIKDVMALSLQQGEDAEVPHDSAERIVDLMLECFDLADLFASSLEEGGITVTPQQRECLGEQMKQNEGFREALINSFSGEEEELSDDEGATLFLDMASACGIDLFGANTGITS